jgi:hypothetical protein
LYCQRFTQSRQWQAPCWPWCVETKMKTILSVLSLHKEEKFVSPESGKWQKIWILSWPNFSLWRQCSWLNNWLIIPSLRFGIH